MVSFRLKLDVNLIIFDHHDDHIEISTVDGLDLKLRSYTLFNRQRRGVNLLYISLTTEWQFH